jgi:hypothetical protein
MPMLARLCPDWRWYKQRMRKSTLPDTELPEVNFSEEGGIRHLHLGSIWVQGSMYLDDPLRLCTNTYSA